LFVGALFGAVIVVLTSSGDHPSDPPSAPLSDDTNYTEALWADHYGSIGELAGEADLVVVGVVEGPEGTREDVQTAGAVSSSLISTYFRIKPLEVIKGDLGVEGILVHQTGGSGSSGARTEVFDDPLFEPGATYLLFLHHYQAPDKYFVLGGPQGRFVVDRNLPPRVFSLSRLYVSREIDDLGIDGFPLAAITKEIDDGASAPAPSRRNP